MYRPGHLLYYFSERQAGQDGPFIMQKLLCNLVLNQVVFHFLMFLCPRMPKAGVGHMAFRRDVTPVRAYARMSRSQPESNKCYSLHSSLHASLPAHLHSYLRPSCS